MNEDDLDLKEYSKVLQLVRNRINNQLVKIPQKNVPEQDKEGSMLFPSLEHYLDVPQDTRIFKAKEVFKLHAQVVGRVFSIAQSQIFFEFVHVFGPRNRKLFDLNLKFVVPLAEFGRDIPEKGEFYKAVMVKCDNSTGRDLPEATTNQFLLPKELHSLKLGKFDISEISEYLMFFGKKSEDRSVLHDLCSIPEFFNKRAIESIEANIGLPQRSSFCSLFLEKPIITSNDLCGDLRRRQLHQHSKELTQKAVGYIRKGNESGALKLLDKAIEVFPHNVDALVALGACYANQKKFELAIPYYEKALDLQPNHSNALEYIVKTTLKLCDVFEQKKQIMDAIDWCNRVMNRPNVPNISVLEERAQNLLLNSMNPNSKNSNEITNSLSNHDRSSKPKSVSNKVPEIKVSSEHNNNHNFSKNIKKDAIPSTVAAYGPLKQSQSLSTTDKKLKHLTAEDLELVNSLLKR